MTKRLLSTLILCAFLPAAHAQDKAKPAPPKPASPQPIQPKPAPPKPDPKKPLAEQIDMKKISYLIGRSYGENLTRSYIDVNLDELVKGLQSALEKKDSMLSQEETNELMTAFRPIHSAVAGHKRKLAAFEVDDAGWDALAAKNRSEGEKFFAENAKKDGIGTTPNGLQYQILKKGSGEIPKMTDKVNAIYKGTLLDGTVFDDSKGQARPFSVSRVVKGWQEALQMMPVGSKWKLFIPSELGYGPDGNRPPIGPDATLVFEMELVSIKKPVQAVTPPVGIDIPQKKTLTPAKPRKRITATTPPVTVPIPKKDGAKAPAPKKDATNKVEPPKKPVEKKKN